MHRLWSIPDVVDEILAHLSLDDDKQVLAYLARTARLFFEPAARRLWSTASVRKMGRLFLMLYKAMPQMTPEIQGYRYQYYQRMIKSFSVVSRGMRPEDVSILLDGMYAAPRRMPGHLVNHATQIRSASLLYDAIYDVPRLFQLDVHINSEECQHVASFSRVARRFLVPSLRELRYHYVASDIPFPGLAILVDFFRTIPNRCSALEYLEIYITSSVDEYSDLSISPALVDVVKNILPVLNRLLVFKAPVWALLPPILDTLARHERLQELGIGDTDPTEPDVFEMPRKIASDLPDTGWFPGLRILTFSGDGALIDHIIPDPELWLEEDAADIPQMPLLQSLHLFDDGLPEDEHIHDAPSNLILLPDLLMRLRVCPALIHIHIGFQVAAPVTDADIDFIVETWPALEEVIIWVHDDESRPLSELTPESLVRFASGCRNLTNLRLDLGTIHAVSLANLTPSRAAIDIHLNARFSELSEPESAILQLETLVTFLWPNHVSYSWHDGTTMHEPGWVEEL